MSKLINIGDKFGYWEIISKSITYRNKNGNGCFTKHIVRCNCGVEKEIKTYSLRSGKSTNCGCKRSENSYYNWPEFRAWQSMKDRCLNAKCHAYKNYGGRGIDVSKSWETSFLNFYNDMGAKPSKKHTLERKDVNRGYRVENCKWATWEEQGANRRTNVYVFLGKEKITLAELARRTKTPYGTIYMFHKNGILALKKGVTYE